jgi:hypothetical protein
MFKWAIYFSGQPACCMPSHRCYVLVLVSFCCTLLGLGCQAHVELRICTVYFNDNCVVTYRASTRCVLSCRCFLLVRACSLCVKVLPCCELVERLAWMLLWLLAAPTCCMLRFCCCMLIVCLLECVKFMSSCTSLKCLTLSSLPYRAYAAYCPFMSLLAWISCSCWTAYPKMHVELLLLHSRCWFPLLCW